MLESQWLSCSCCLCLCAIAGHGHIIRYAKEIMFRLFIPTLYLFLVTIPQQLITAKEPLSHTTPYVNWLAIEDKKNHFLDFADNWYAPPEFVTNLPLKKKTCKSAWWSSKDFPLVYLHEECKMMDTTEWLNWTDIPSKKCDSHSVKAFNPGWEALVPKNITLS